MATAAALLGVSGLARADDTESRDRALDELERMQQVQEAAKSTSSSRFAEDRAARVTPGFGASLRLAYGAPVGKLSGASGDDLSLLFSGSLPIQLDVGYRFTPQLSAAVFGQYAFGFTASGGGSAGAACSASGVSCSTRDLRLGAELFYHARPGQKLDPWLGLGMAYEWGNFTAEAGGVSADVKIRGFEFLNLQAGLDYALASGFGFGPFVQFTLGQYSTVDAGSQSADITNTALHSWLQFGFRGTLNL